MQISIIDGIDVAVEDFSLFQVFTIKHGVARFCTDNRGNDTYAWLWRV